MPQDPSTQPQRKTVGVYDRPASADRPKSRPVVLIVIVVAALAAVLWYVFGR